MFAELASRLTEKDGFAAIIVKSALVTSTCYSSCFRHFVNQGSLSEVFLFDNREKLFQIDSREKFCVLFFGGEHAGGIKVHYGLTKQEQIIDSEININNCREIKEYIRKQFNVILNKNGWNDCMDSTSVLTTEKRHFTKGNHTEFSIDLAIVFNDRNGCHRLIHEKTGFTAWDRYYWNLVPNSRNLFDKVAAIKDEHLWDEVIDEYLEKKNMYLRRQDYNHPSFNVYVETVNQVFNKYFD